MSRSRSPIRKWHRERKREPPKGDLAAEEQQMVLVSFDENVSTVAPVND